MIVLSVLFYVPTCVFFWIFLQISMNVLPWWVYVAMDDV